MKKCELCDSPAKMYCESDQASLCWNCDAKVHAANFLVAKHLRTLLCNRCQSPTPWTASGRNLTPTASVCSNCVASSSRRNGRRRNSDNEDNAGGGGGDDDEENQVVPWSVPPPDSSSSNSDE